MNKLPELKLDHLKQLTDGTGMFQHARFHIPDRNHGYCLDDNVRALLLMTKLRQYGMRHSEIEDLVVVYLSFIDYAYNPETKKYRNFMSYSREWLEDAGSDDSMGRTFWAVATLYADENFQFYKGYFDKLLDQCWKIENHSPLAVSFTLLGLINLEKSGISTKYPVRERIECEVEKLESFFEENSRANWPWFTEHVTYDSARIPLALLSAGYRLEKSVWFEKGLKILDWLITHQFEGGVFKPIGNQYWMTQGGKSDYDQQPLEAAAMMDACLEAGITTGDSKYFHYAKKAFAWFLGENSQHVFLYDPFTGGCRDGIGIQGVNQNQGAESTLAWLSSLLTMKIHEKYLFPQLEKNFL